ncbi:MAG: DUF971 domain-containing protein [Ignavibacteriae bacterium]|jgi:DUF971 family protein|nr:DUF971 domain-containing protein [Ignavibacteriota bacterium]NOG98251.1 DUF971 domain-containing protein [Ignavibacteriota bacterium]
MSPQKIQVKDSLLVIDWSDGKKSEIKLSNLRKNCPCALCAAEEEEQGAKYIPLYSGDQLKITEIKIVGHYAVSINWKDGHNTGIYEFDHLRELGGSK